MMNASEQLDCETNVRRIEAILASGIFNPDNMGQLFQESAFIELMIRLRDLMHKAEKHARRISFTDDVLVNEYVKDVTDAITAVRDACCHIDSFKRAFDMTSGGRGSYLVAYGKCNLIQIDQLQLKSEYDDDTAVFYGSNRLYFRRHIVRALNEAKVLLAPHMLRGWA